MLEAHKTEKMLIDGYIPLPKIVYPIDVVAGYSVDETSKKRTEIIDLTNENAKFLKNLQSCGRPAGSFAFVARQELQEFACGF